MVTKMPAKHREGTPRTKLLTDFLVYLGVRSLIALIQALPLRVCYRLSAAIAALAYRLDRRHRRVALENLRHAFGTGQSDAQIERLVEAVYQHFAAIIVEMAFIPRKLHETNWRDSVQLRDHQRIVELLLTRSPVILQTGHFGNWEVAGYLFGLFGFKPYSVARTLDNPFLERLVRSFRMRTGQRIIYKRGAYDQVEQVLRRGALLAFLNDQDAGQRGLFVEFFGRPASTHKGVGLLALQFRAPIVVGYARRLGPGIHYELAAADVILPEEVPNGPEALRYVTQRAAWALEAAIRQAPEQYLWLHRRWKHSPRRLDPPEQRAAA
jgi:KDO2-lipid IV(A) lauroyltransferase